MAARPTENELASAARKVVRTLLACEAIEGETHRPDLEKKIATAFRRNFDEEAAIERDAQKMLAQHARQAVGMDQHKLLMRFKEKIASERGFVL